ncbi:integrin alpha-PS3 isoform X1 [Procambarus clarkii]|uniref:integrin alpha-PS3 isoform X1 n=2 Tax=Procambarus clarkii TaxID=6728 RepID=UPI003743EC3D
MPQRSLLRSTICIILLGILTEELLLVTCFNLETQEAQVFTYPYANTQGRESYFGFSVALQRRTNDDTSWLVVGAPRANSSHYNPTRFKEPGVIFKCSLVDGACRELFIDQTANNVSQNQHNEFMYQDLKNEGWLGASLDSQPRYEAGRQATGVCAPRWRNQYYPQTYLMNGACYWLNQDLLDAPAHKRLPLIQLRKQTYPIFNRPLFFYSHGEAGMSLHFPDDPTEMIVGAPGVFNWQGTVIRFKDVSPPVPGEISRRRRRRRQAIVTEDHMFTSQLVPNPYFTANIEDFDLMGYAVTSGRFLREDEILYASGAPRGASSLGKVIVFAFPEDESQPFNVKAEWQGTQLGENFGAALTAADINGDGLSDLVVGSPMFSQADIPDMGRIQVYLSVRDDRPHRSEINYFGSRTHYARFGTTLASPGDLNGDGYADVVVGAPWEGDGAVYVYLGSPRGLKQAHSQRISPEDFQQPLSGFGMALSRGTDIDNNDYPDLAIGSFISGHVVVLKARPVAALIGSMKATPSTITLQETSLQLLACLNYYGHKVPRHVSITGNIYLDSAFQSPRAYFTDTNAFVQEFKETIALGQEQCKTYAVSLKPDKVDPRQPLVLRMDYQLVETPGMPIITQPVADPGVQSHTTSRVSVVTGCELDGDDTCRVDMHIKTSFQSYGSGKKLIIGDDNKPVMKVEVFNLGEPVFLPNVTVKVIPPLALFLPSSHDCEFPGGNRTSLVCRLANPITKDGKDVVEVQLDANQLTDKSQNVVVDVFVSGEGQEIRPQDNAFSQGLQLEAHASLKIHGSSKEEQVVYERLGEDKINITKPLSFIHHFTLAKKGPTPLEQVDFVIDIPVNFTENENFIKIYAPTSNFLGQPVLCSISGTFFAVNTINNGDNSNAIETLNNLSGSIHSTTTPEEPLSSNDDALHVKKADEDRVVNVKEAVEEVALDLSCSNSHIKCARLYCRANSWPENDGSAQLSFKLEVDLAVLARHISAKAGAVLKSTATATIQSLNSDLAFVGVRSDTIEVQTQIQPDTLPGKGVPWWVILLAVLGGLLLLGLLAYGLYKAGFFQRKEYEELKAQQARVESNDGYSSSNAGLVGD